LKGGGEATKDRAFRGNCWTEGNKVPSAVGGGKGKTCACGAKSTRVGRQKGGGKG